MTCASIIHTHLIIFILIQVMILKYLVMWQFKGSEKIQALRDKEAENIIRPVEVEALGVDSKGSTYFYLGGKDLNFRSIKKKFFFSFTTVLC